MSAVSTPPTTTAPARRDAEATKAAILKAARYLLARHAHADITLKAVAERAGVSAPLILKYFGNKDALFARVMSFETDADALLDGHLVRVSAQAIDEDATRDYQVVYPETLRDDPAVRAFCDWLHAEVAALQQRLNQAPEPN